MKKPCDIATGELTHNGYVRVKRWVGGRLKNVRAYRLAWEEAHGPIPRGLYVLHECDNRACREITHLFLGTAKDNTADCRAKGRLAVGERAGNSKLNEEFVAMIKASRLSTYKLAKIYGVSQTQIQRIRTGKAWAHVS
jgi:hypothetical protein